MASSEYSPRAFLREASNALLARYFHERGYLEEVDIASLGETDIERVHEEWERLQDEVQVRVDSDFRHVEALANEVGTQTLLDEAPYHDLDLGPAFSETDGFHDRALLCLLDQRDVFDVALLLAEAENRPRRYWRRRKDVPKLEPKLEPEAVAELERTFSAYFQEREARGQSCKIDVYPRDRTYFFAYLSDYGRTDVEWEGAVRTRRSHRPAFEIIFAYSQTEGVLDYYAEVRKPIATDLQEIFGRVILGTELGDPEQDERVYELNLLKNRGFQFVREPTWGIRDVRVKRMRLSSLAGKRRITLEDDPSSKRDAIYDFLDDVVDTNGTDAEEGRPRIPLAMLNITKVGIEAVFEGDGSPGRNTKTFDVGYPNSCDLKHDERDLILRQMLVKSGIDVSLAGTSAAPS